MAAKLFRREAAVEVGSGEVGLQRERLVEVGEGLLEAPQVALRVAAVTEPSRLGVIGGRGLVSLQPGLREATVVEGSGVFGVQPDRRVKVGDHFRGFGTDCR